MVASVLVVGAQKDIRQKLCLRVDSTSEFRVVAKASDGVGAIATAHAHQPDLALIDTHLLDTDGATVTRELMNLDEHPKVLLLSDCDVHDCALDALMVGASGVLRRDLPARQLTAALRAVLLGACTVVPEALDELVRRAREQDNRRARNRRSLAQLGDDELLMLELIGAGLANTQIARRLCMSKTTVKSQASQIFTKLNLKNRIEAAALACELGLVPTGASGSSHHAAGAWWAR